MASERGRQGHGPVIDTPAAFSDRAARSTAASGGRLPADHGADEHPAAGPAPDLAHQPAHLGAVVLAAAAGLGRDLRVRRPGGGERVFPGGVDHVIAGLDQHPAHGGLRGGADRQRVLEQAADEALLLARARSSASRRSRTPSARWRCRRCRSPACAGRRFALGPQPAGDLLEHPQHRVVHGRGQRVVPLPRGERAAVVRSWRIRLSGPLARPASSAASACGILNVEAGLTRSSHAGDEAAAGRLLPSSVSRKHEREPVVATGAVGAAPSEQQQPGRQHGSGRGPGDVRGRRGLVTR